MDVVSYSKASSAYKLASLVSSELVNKADIAGSSILVPVGTTATRPVLGAGEAALRYNSDIGGLEEWTGTEWKNVSANISAVNLKGTDTEVNILAMVGMVAEDLWIASDTLNGLVYDGAVWINIGPLRGPQGIQGIQGLTGEPGVSISSVDRTGGDGSAGTIDTYTITYTDLTTSTFTVYNGADGVVAIPGSGGYAANVYLTTLESVTGGTYKQLSYTPEVDETILSTVVNNNTVLIEDYIFDGDVGASIIPAGEWGFHIHRRVDNTAADTTIRFDVYKRTAGGLETVLFTVSTKIIEDTTFVREDLLVTKTGYTIDPTDRVGIKVYASTTRTSNVTVELKIGDGEAGYLNTPLAIRHNQLRARDDNDSHPMSAITGLTSALSYKLDIATYTAADVLAKLKTADGADSGLHADLLDGQHGSYYATASQVGDIQTALTAILGV